MGFLVSIFIDAFDHICISANQADRYMDSEAFGKYFHYPVLQGVKSYNTNLPPDFREFTALSIASSNVSSSPLTSIQWPESSLGRVGPLSPCFCRNSGLNLSQFSCGMYRSILHYKLGYPGSPSLFAIIKMIRANCLSSYSLTTFMALKGLGRIHPHIQGRHPDKKNHDSSHPAGGMIHQIHYHTIDMRYSAS